MRVVILLLLISSCYGLLWFNQMQSVGVKGKLVCNGKPAEGVKVKLYEKEIFFDRKLDQGKTGAHGEFKLWGSAREISNIDPQLNIYHKCNHRGKIQGFVRLITGLKSEIYYSDKEEIHPNEVWIYNKFAYPDNNDHS